MKNQNRLVFPCLFASMIMLSFTMVGCRVGLWSSPTTHEPTQSNLVGMYISPEGWLGEKTTLNLKADNTFEMIDSESFSQKGSWQIEGNKISLTYQKQGANRTRLVGFVSDNERGFYLVLWREGNDPDDAIVFVPPW